MKKLRLFSISFLLLMASSAFGQYVDFKFDDAADFSKFRTYKWVPFKNAAPIDKLTDEQIKAAVDAALAQKGLAKVDDDPADLLIDFQSGELISQEFPKSSYDGEARSTEQYHGTLAIDMYIPVDHHLVWRGVASKTLDPKADAEKRQKNLNKAVAKLMKRYPPPK